jgi:CheY-like chemotaxis protein
MSSSNGNTRKAARILVIDDEPVLRVTFKHLLEGEGYRVWTASNGREGLDIFRQHPVDLVITDIVMPEMDGYEIIENIRRESPGLPIIAMSAVAAEQQMQRPLTDPAFCCVSKPLDQRVLFDLVRAILVPPPLPGAQDVDGVSSGGPPL